jgi:hypothetical protein
MEWLFALPCQVVSYLVAHTFGLRLVYPGSISMLQYVMGECFLMPECFIVKGESLLGYFAM